MADDLGGAGPYYRMCGKHVIAEECNCDPNSYCNCCGYRDFDEDDIFCQKCGNRLKPEPAKPKQPKPAELECCPQCGIWVFEPETRYCFNCDKHFKTKKKAKK